MTVTLDRYYENEEEREGAKKYHMLFTGLTLTVDCPTTITSTHTLTPTFTASIASDEGNFPCAGTNSDIYLNIISGTALETDYDKQLSRFVLIDTNEVEYECLASGINGTFFTTEGNRNLMQCVMISPPATASFDVYAETILGVRKLINSEEIQFISDADWNVRELQQDSSNWVGTLSSGESARAGRDFDWKGEDGNYLLLSEDIKEVSYIYSENGSPKDITIPYLDKPNLVVLSTYAIQVGSNDKRRPKICIRVDFNNGLGDFFERCNMEVVDSKDGMDHITVNVTSADMVLYREETTISIILIPNGEENTTLSAFPVIFTKIEVTADCASPSTEFPSKPILSPPEVSITPLWGCSIDVVNDGNVYKLELSPTDGSSFNDNGADEVVDITLRMGNEFEVMCELGDYSSDRRVLPCSFTYTEAPLRSINGMIATLNSVFEATQDSVPLDQNDSSNLALSLLTSNAWRVSQLTGATLNNELTSEEAVSVVEIDGVDGISEYLWVHKNARQASADLSLFISPLSKDFYFSTQVLLSHNDTSFVEICLLTALSELENEGQLCETTALANSTVFENQTESQMQTISLSYSFSRLEDVPTLLVFRRRYDALPVGVSSDSVPRYPFALVNMKLYENCRGDLAAETDADANDFRAPVLESVSPRGICSYEGMEDVVWLKATNKTKFRDTGVGELADITISVTNEESAVTEISCNGTMIVDSTVDLEKNVTSGDTIRCVLIGDSLTGTITSFTFTSTMNETVIHNVSSYDPPLLLLLGGETQNQLSSVWTGDEVFETGLITTNRDGSPHEYIELMSGFIKNTVTTVYRQTNYQLTASVLIHPLNSDKAQVCLIFDDVRYCESVENDENIPVMRTVILNQQTSLDTTSVEVVLTRQGLSNSSLPLVFSDVFLSRSCDTAYDKVLDITVKLPQIARISPRVICPGESQNTQITIESESVFGTVLTDGTAVVDDLNRPRNIVLAPGVPCVPLGDDATSGLFMRCEVGMLPSNTTVSGSLSFESEFEKFPSLSDPREIRFSVQPPSSNFISIHDDFQVFSGATALSNTSMNDLRVWDGTKKSNTFIRLSGEVSEIRRSLSFTWQPDRFYIAAYLSHSLTDPNKPEVCYQFHSGPVIEDSPDQVESAWICHKESENQGDKYAPNIYFETVEMEAFNTESYNITVAYRRCSPSTCSDLSSSTSKTYETRVLHLVLHDMNRCIGDNMSERELYGRRDVDFQVNTALPLDIQCLPTGSRVFVIITVTSDFFLIDDVDWISVDEEIEDRQLDLSLGRKLTVPVIFPWIPSVKVAGQPCLVVNYMNDTTTSSFSLNCSVSVPSSGVKGPISITVLNTEVSITDIEFDTFSFLECGQSEASFARTVEDAANTVTTASLVIGFVLGVFTVFRTVTAHTLNKPTNEASVGDLFRFIFYIQFVSSLAYTSISFPPSTATFLHNFAWTNGMILPPWGECVDPNEQLAVNSTRFLGQLPDQYPCSIPSEGLFTAIAFSLVSFSVGLTILIQIFLSLLSLLWTHSVFLRSKIDIETLSRFPSVPLLVFVRMLLIMVNGLVFGIVYQFTHHPNDSQAVGLASLAFILFLVGLPIMNYLAVLKVSSNGEVLSNEMQDKVQFILGSLYNDFSPDKRFLSLLYLLKRILVAMLLGGLTNSPEAQYSIIIILGIGWAVFCQLVQPYSIPRQNTLHVALEVAEVLVSFFIIIYEASSAWYLLSLALLVSIAIGITFIYLTIRNTDCCSRAWRRFRRRVGEKPVVEEGDFEIQEIGSSKAIEGAQDTKFGSRSTLNLTLTEHGYVMSDRRVREMNGRERGASGVALVGPATAGRKGRKKMVEKGEVAETEVVKGKEKRGREKSKGRKGSRRSKSKRSEERKKDKKKKEHKKKKGEKEREREKGKKKERKIEKHSTDDSSPNAPLSSSPSLSPTRSSPDEVYIDVPAVSPARPAEGNERERARQSERERRRRERVVGESQVDLLENGELSESDDGTLKFMG